VKRKHESLIVTHLNADFDALASVVLAIKLFPEAKVFFPGSQESHVREYLKTHPWALPLAEPDEVRHGTFSPCILMDVGSAERLGAFAFLLQSHAGQVWRIDHHPCRLEALPGWELCEHVRANTTLLIRLLRERKLTLTAPEATLALLGIFEETGNLTFASTLPEDAMAAAFCIEKGASLHEVRRHLDQELTAEQRGVLRDWMRYQTIRSLGKLEWMVSHAVRETYVPDMAVVASKMMEWMDLDFAVLLCEFGGRIYVLLRSRTDQMDVSLLASELGGGGHAYAAAATIRNQTRAQVEARICNFLQVYSPRFSAGHQTDEPDGPRGVLPVSALAPRSSPATASEIMQGDVVTVAAEAELGQAVALMLQVRHSRLPVEASGRIVGWIGLQDIHKALHHGMERILVRSVMHSRLAWVASEASLREVQEFFNSFHHEIVLVGSPSSLAGIITPVDLIRSMPEAKRQPLRVSAGVAEPPELLHTMRICLPGATLHLLHLAGEIGRELGGRVYAVGGMVRDLLLGQASQDLDLMVEGDPEELAAEMAKRLGGGIKVHSRFRTARLTLPEHPAVDIAMARTEHYEQPGTLPVVRAARLRYDLLRRDFTVNAMAMDIHPDAFGTLIDVYNGWEDLRAGLLRVLYSHSFLDDPLRMIRALRFEHRLGMRLEEDSQRYFETALKQHFNHHLSASRLADEMVKVFSEPHPLPILRRMQGLGMLGWFHPEFQQEAELPKVAALEGFCQFALQHGLECPQREDVYLLALADKLDDATFLPWLLTFHWPRARREALINLRRSARSLSALLGSLTENRMGPIVALLSEQPLNALALARAIIANRAAELWVEQFVAQWRHLVPELSGKELAAFGLEKPHDYIAAIGKLLDERLQGRLLAKKEEREFFLKLKSEPL
jgi:tRNA nucleotidyltransferase (CCA-adding enzyme)